MEKKEILNATFIPFIKSALLSAIGDLLPKLRKNCKEMIASVDCNLI